VEYRIVFYATGSGNKPMVDFLESLRGKNDALHKLVTAGLLKLKLRDNHGPPLTSPIQGSPGLYELRVGRTDIARVFFFFQPNREIVCTNGYVKKSQKLDPGEIARAERYKADWERRTS
jgi:phage-related protein